jgi:hypothetical protein
MHAITLGRGRLAVVRGHHTGSVKLTTQLGARKTTREGRTGLLIENMARELEAVRRR